MSERILVTGANGHLGNTLVRALVAGGKHVRAGVRDPAARTAFEDLDCEVVRADLLDRSSLATALSGVDTFYQVGAVFSHWARDARREIVEANLTMTRNAVELAAQAGVRKVVYVSSAAALDRKVVPINESTWNRDLRNPYFHAKTVAEQLALRRSAELGLPLVSVLPWAIVGPNVYRKPTPTMGALMAIMTNRLPFDPGFCFNFVHVADVADGLVRAAERGRPGERYLLGSESGLSFRRVAEIAHALFPHVRVPPPIARYRLLLFAAVMEAKAWVTKTAPPLRLSVVQSAYHADLRSDISKAKTELGFSPRPPEEAIENTLRYIQSSLLQSTRGRRA